MRDLYLAIFILGFIFDSRNIGILSFAGKFMLESVDLAFVENDLIKKVLVVATNWNLYREWKLYQQIDWLILT